MSIVSVVSVVSIVSVVSVVSVVGVVGVVGVVVCSMFNVGFIYGNFTQIIPTANEYSCPIWGSMVKLEVFGHKCFGNCFSAAVFEV